MSHPPHAAPRPRTVGASPSPRVAADAPGVIHLQQCKLTVVKGQQRGRELVVSSDVIRVGKAEENDLVLVEDTVSRMHLEILRDAKGWLLRDLHSTNGTFLDGAEIREAYIRPGAVITAGTVQLRFQPFEDRIEIRPSDGETLGALYGRSLAMRTLFGLVERLAGTDATLLLVGEPGTGKDAVARELHARSRRRSGPFLSVDCRALAGRELETALFGQDKAHDKAHDKATTPKGALELAHGGTLYLDHVGELGLDVQPKLLKVLEQRELRREGGRSVKIDVRFVASTEQELRREVEKGKLREDLFFRLAVATARVPPLRERREDIAGLVERLAVRALYASGLAPSPPSALTEKALAGLAKSAWPGNVRELDHVVLHALDLALPFQVNFADVNLPGEPAGGGGASPSPSLSAPAFAEDRSYRENKAAWEDAFERGYLRWLLARADGNISRAARDADMDRKYLHKLLKKHRIVG